MRLPLFITARTQLSALILIPGVLLLLPLSGCLNVSVTQSSGGGGSDASSCISIQNPGESSDKAVITNSCNVAVNFIEFSTGSLGLITIDPMRSVTQDETIFAWGACVAPAIPDRVEEFDFRCVNV